MPGPFFTQPPGTSGFARHLLVIKGAAEVCIGLRNPKLASKNLDAPPLSTCAYSCTVRTIGSEACLVGPPWLFGLVSCCYAHVLRSERIPSRFSQIERMDGWRQGLTERMSGHMLWDWSLNFRPGMNNQRAAQDYNGGSAGIFEKNSAQPCLAPFPDFLRSESSVLRMSCPSVCWCYNVCTSVPSSPFLWRRLLALPLPAALINLLA